MYFHIKHSIQQSIIIYFLIKIHFIYKSLLLKIWPLVHLFVINPRGVVFSRALTQGKTTSRGLTAWCSSPMQAKKKVLYQNCSKKGIKTMSIHLNFTLRYPPKYIVWLNFNKYICATEKTINWLETPYRMPISYNK